MRLGIVLAITAVFAAAQQSDEVRVSAHIYTPPQLHLTAQTSLVQLGVVVRNPRGQAVSGLKQSDFEVLDEGKPRDITAFSVETRDATQAAAAPVTPRTSTTTDAPPAVKTPAAPPPRSTMLFFDDLHGAAADLQRTKLAAERFIKEGMGPGARAAVFGSSEGLTLDFTADTGALTAAIEKLRAHQRYSENGVMPCPRITPYQAYLIANNRDFDALNAAVEEMKMCNSTDPGTVTATKRNPGLPSTSRTNPLVETVRAQAAQTWEVVQEQSVNSLEAVENALTLLERAPGSRVLLVVSTGFLTGMLDKERTEAIDHAIHGGIVINALDAKGLWSEAPSRPFNQPLETASLPLETFLFETSTIGSRNDAMNDAMQEFASGTGGLFFHNNNDLAGGFAQLAAVPDTTYLLAIRPDPEAAAGKYHKLKVRLTSKSSDYVQTRPGYFAPAPAAPGASLTEARPLDQALSGSDVLTGVPIQVTARPGKTDKGDPVVSTLIHVDISPLKFAKRDDRHVQKLSFIGALLDSSGKMVLAKEGAMDLALKDDTLARLTGSGLNAGLTFPAPPGDYKLRVVVQDADGKMAAQNLAVAIGK